MKKSLLTLLTATMLLSTSMSAQTLSVQPIEAQTGEQTEMVVSLTGGTAMTALQFNLKLPDGVTLSESGDNYGATLSNATDGHTLCVESLASGDFLFVLYSLGQKPFRDGELLRIPVTFASDAKSATGQLNTIRMADAEAVSYAITNADITTGVREVRNEEMKTDEWAGTVYDLSGRTVKGALPKGVYIRGGRKVMK